MVVSEQPHIRSLRCARVCSLPDLPLIVHVRHDLQIELLAFVFILVRVVVDLLDKSLHVRPDVGLAQAMRALCPMTMPGTPGSDAPITSNGHSALTGWQCSAAKYHIAGI